MPFKLLLLLLLFVSFISSALEPLEIDDVKKCLKKNWRGLLPCLQKTMC